MSAPNLAKLTSTNGTLVSDCFAACGSGFLSFCRMRSHWPRPNRAGFILDRFINQNQRLSVGETATFQKHLVFLRGETATFRARGRFFHVVLADLFLPSSHYSLGSVSRTYRTLPLPRFWGPSRGSRRTFLAEREGGVPMRSSRAPGDHPWGLSLCRDSPSRTSGRSRESGK